MNEPPICVTFTELDKHHLHRVKIIGIYVNDWMGLGPVEFYARHVRIAMPDCRRGPMLNFPWKPEAKRDPDEIARLGGKHVVVVGTYYDGAPPAPGQPAYAANFTPPCMVVESIRLAGPAEIPDLGEVPPYRESFGLDDEEE